MRFLTVECVRMTFVGLLASVLCCAPTASFFFTAHKPNRSSVGLSRPFKAVLLDKGVGEPTCPFQTISSAMESSNHQQAEAEASYGFKESEWSFNEKVAQNWLGEMEGHIPSYWHVINLSADIVCRLHSPSARMLIFWAATGNQLLPYMKLGWNANNFFGVNYSEPLDAEFRNRFPIAGSRLADEKLRPYNPIDDAPFDVVQMHWSLHFEPVEERTQVLRNIHASLNPGGTLLLTDKTKQSSVVEAMYHDFKRSKGVSNAEIDAKKQAIVGVLTTLPSHWYETTLKALGFVDVCVIHSHLGFVTWVARKSA